MKEEQIRPKKILNEYLRLAEIDANTFFSNCQKNQIPCVACGEKEELKFEFEKCGFEYHQCNSCHTLFLSPRPEKKYFDDFYIQSPSSDYWANTFFPTVAEARREKLFKPKAQKIVELCLKRKLNLETHIDVGAGYGILLEEVRKISPQTKLMAVEPGKELAEVCRSKDLEVLEAVSEESEIWAGKADLVTSFEVIEHAYSPIDFIKSLVNLAKPGGQVLITGLGVEGFDIQMLWEKSKSIFPPHHINFLSIEGFHKLFEEAGLKNVEVLTPGVLDFDIVKNYSEEFSLEMPRFFKTLMNRSQEHQEEFQKFLVNNQLSSHVWVIGTKE